MTLPRITQEQRIVIKALLEKRRFLPIDKTKKRRYILSIRESSP